MVESNSVEDELKLSGGLGDKCDRKLEKEEIFKNIKPHSTSDSKMKDNFFTSGPSLVKNLFIWWKHAIILIHCGYNPYPCLSIRYRILIVSLENSFEFTNCLFFRFGHIRGALKASFDQIFDDLSGYKLSKKRNNWFSKKSFQVATLWMNVNISKNQVPTT